MFAETETHTTGPLELKMMTARQRLAVLLILLGPEGAGQILRKFDEQEIEEISEAIINLPPISQAAQDEILQDFSEAVVETTAGISGGVAQVRPILEKAVGATRAAGILNRQVQARPVIPALQPLLALEPESLVKLLRQEQPQTIALVVSHIEPELVSKLLVLLPEDVRDSVVERLATLAPTPVEVIERIAKVLQLKINKLEPAAPPARTGGLRAAANILNILDKDLARTILAGLGERQPELSQSIINQMFTFDDLATVDNLTLQRIMREVDSRCLALALRNTPERLKRRLLGCLSKRSAGAVNEEISYLGTVKIKEVEGARRQIIEAVRRLEGEGEIDITEARQQPRYALSA